MIPGRSARRALLCVALVAMLWSLALKITGGFAIETEWRLVSSRNALRPLVAGLALTALYLAMWRRHWRGDLGPFSRPATWPPVIAGISTAVALILGFGWGTRIGAGPDQSGYVSTAAMFARGELTMAAPYWSRNAPWDDAAYTASPIGWRPTPQTHILAPTYSAGLPLMMAMFQLAAGPDSVFYVVPLAGGLLAWSTYLLGSRLGGPWAGAIAAALAVSSPIFLLMQQQAMSDIPVAAFLTLSMAAALPPAHPWLAGIAAGAAVTTRPNLVPLLIIPVLLLAGRERALRRLVAFSIPVGAACAFVGTLNWYYFGSPLESGYGPLAGYYSLDSIEPNLRQYGRWFLRTQTPLALAGVLAAFVSSGNRTHRGRIALVTLAPPLAVLAIYMPYLVFYPNDWGYLRFLLPGYTSLLAGVGVVAVAAVARAGRRWPALAAAAILVGAVAAHGWTLSFNDGVFMQRVGDARYARAVDFARQLPERSVFISNSHSGTLRFYTGRDILRFEVVRPAELDVALDHLRRHGYDLFFIGDEFEIDMFRERFPRSRAVAALNEKTHVSLGGVVVYPLVP